jgi:uncharacterized protein
MMQTLFALLRATAATGRLNIAYSGGLDSRFLAHAAQKAGVPCQLFHCSGPHVPLAETAYALRWAQQNALPLRLVPCNPLNLPAVATGSKERCYACKYTLFSQILKELNGQSLCDGSNASDAEQFRPGRRAVQELGIVSPLLLAGITKAQVRLLAQQTGLEQPQQPARPCLLTRLPYGLPPSAALLRGIEQCEAAVLSVFAQSYAGQEQPDFRVRCLATGQFVIHCTLMPHEAVLKRLRQALDALGLYAPVMHVEELSGFFDRKSSVSDTASTRSLTPPQP